MEFLIAKAARIEYRSWLSEVPRALLRGQPALADRPSKLGVLLAFVIEFFFLREFTRYM